MGGTKAAPVMSGELFWQPYPKDGVMRSVDDVIDILDAGGYWGGREVERARKVSHVKRRLKLKTHVAAGWAPFVSWPAPFKPTLPQHAVHTYNLHVVGVAEEVEPEPEGAVGRPGVVVSMRGIWGKVHQVEVSKGGAE